MDNVLGGLSSYRLGARQESASIDWWLFLSIIPILGAGLATMHSFTGDASFATHQFIWIGISLLVFFSVSRADVRFLRSTWLSVALYAVSVALLATLFVIGKVSHGAVGWFDLGAFSFQPADFAKIALIIVLAKYFSRRHIEIAHIRHILISGLYAFVFFVLILVQPDLGSAVIVALIWLGMIMVSGVSKKHLLGMIGLAAVVFALLWNFGFKEYQKDRIRTFIDPFADIHGAGYNAYQSAIAIGSGGLFGKGVGYGTQSRLKFLPEYQTDFIFAAFAEEWGFVGVVILFGLYGILIWRIIVNALHGASNFEILFGAGVAVFFIVHIAVNVGMNMHLLPVTGTPLPLMSYGGTHIMIEFLALGLTMAMRRYSRSAHKDAAKNEFVGPQ
ncbi:MAG: rod shape determining protein RodA [Candidatus Parcubacteria bacterium]|jgi:rod shape determining protein RodA|nr:rod shape determining protein RodA [Candidatus Parcubacteria bacterium]